MANTLTILTTLTLLLSLSISTLSPRQHYDLSQDLQYQDFEKAILHIDSAITLSEELGDLRQKAEYTRKKGILYKRKEAFDTARVFYNDALRQFSAISDSIGIASVYNNLGIINYRLGLLEEALEDGLKSFGINSRNNYQVGMIRNMIMIANIYQYDHQDEKALSMYKEALSHPAISGVVASQALLFQNIGVIYGKFGSAVYNADSALSYYEKSLVIYQELGEVKAIINLTNNKGVVFERQGNYEKAINFYDEALRLRQGSGFDSDMTYSYQNLGNAYFELGDLAKAEAYHQLAYDSARSKSQLAVWRNMSNKLAGYLEKQEKYKEALVFLHQYDSLDEVLSSVQKIQNRDEIQARYEVAKRTAELTRITGEKNQLEIEKQGYLIALAIFLVLAIVVVLIYQQRQNAIRSLHERELNELRLQRELDELNARMDGEEKERRRLAQELHDRVGSMLIGLQHQLENQLSPQNGGGKSLNLLSEAIDETRNLAHSLASGILAKFGLVAALKDLKAGFEAEGQLGFHLEIMEEPSNLKQELEADLFRVVQELLSNTLKHGAATEVNLQLMLDTDEISLLYSDNGKGFDPNQQAGGIGLENIKARIHKHLGQFSLDSQPGQGIAAAITIKHNQNEKAAIGR